MDKEEYQAELQKVYMFCSVVKALPLEEMHNALSHALTIGPLIDPTLYIQKGRAAEEDLKIIDAVLSLKRRIEGVETHLSKVKQ